MFKNFLFLASFFMIHMAQAYAQNNDSINVIRLKGNVFDNENKRPVSTVMVVNKRTQQGFFSGEGSFEVKILTTDTMLIGSQGYRTIAICMRDSGKKEQFEFNLYLDKLSYTAKEVEVFGARDLDKIQQDIEKLGYDKKDFVLSDFDALNSPITFLYQQFSRKEKAKRALAELKNNDMKRALLKELFARYVASDMMDLETSAFDDFIDYCNVSDEFMKNSTQYEFILFIKKKYEIYKMIKAQNK